MSPPILQVEDLRVHYPVMGGGLVRREHLNLRAVDGVSFELGAGETPRRRR